MVRTRCVEQPRATDSNKGKYGHVLVIGGSVGEVGRAGDGIHVGIASWGGTGDGGCAKLRLLAQVSAFAPELMTSADAGKSDG